MKINENLTTNLKITMNKRFGETGGVDPVERMQNQNDFNNALGSLGENKDKNKKEQVIKRKIKRGVSDKIVGTPKLDKPIGKMYSFIGGESKESTGSGSAGGYSAPLFSVTKKEMEEMKQTSFKAPKLTMFSDEAPKPIKSMNESCWKGYKQNGMKDKNGKKVPNCVPIKESEEVEEKWSKKYKDSIDCDNPKGFSQKAHCQGKVKKVETKEATGSASSGSYVTTAAWAKSTNKKDWRGKSKTQIPGGKFVQVKEKCKKFPYCNQGDIKALNIFENETFKKVIKNISEKHGISENVIKSILSYEYYNVK
jgi:hypothetical protein